MGWKYVKKLGKKIEIINKLNILVKLIKNPILSQYFINLTGITNNNIKNNEVSFKKCMRDFYLFCKHNNKLVNVYSYGNNYMILKKNMDYNKILNNSKFRKWEKFFFDMWGYNFPFYGTQEK